MKNVRKQQLMQLIAENTSVILASRNISNVNTDAYTISLDLKVDRANISRILNRLWRENELIKIQGRPMYYLHRKTIQNRYPNSYIPSVIPKNESIFNYLENDKPLGKLINTDNKMIGNSINESLKGIIDDIEVYSDYPSRFKSMMLYGEQFCGKHYIVYSILDKKDQSNFINLDMRLLEFGSVKIKDIVDLIQSSLKKSKNNVILFENMEECLDQYRISHNFISFLAWMKDYTINHRLNCFLVILCNITDINEIDCKLNTVIEKFYFVKNINDRTLKEKYEFIFKFLQQESNIINCSLSISYSVLNCFATARYYNSLNGLLSEIKASLSTAYASKKEEDSTIFINFENLSEALLESIDNVSEQLAQIKSVNFFLRDKVFFLIPGTECIPLSNLLKVTVDNNGMVLSENEINKKITLREYCLKEMDEAKNFPGNQIYFHLLKKIEDILEIFDENIKEDDVKYKLEMHINNVIHIVNQRSYIPFFSVKQQEIKMENIEIAEKITKKIEENYHIRYPNEELLFIAMYLQLYHEKEHAGPLGILVLCQGNGIAEKYASHVNTMKYSNYCNFMDYLMNEELSLQIEKICNKVRSINKGAGVIILTDFNPMVDIDTLIKSRTEIETVTVTPLSLPLLVQIMDMIEANHELSDFKSIRNMNLYQVLNLKEKYINTETQIVLDDVANNILVDSLIFLDAQKATYTLFRVVMKIYEDLELQFSKDITIRFIFHGSFMIERVIRNETLVYKDIPAVIEKNAKIYQAIDKNLQLVNRIFGITIPPGEIARITEIFVDLIQSEVNRY